jgi:hypothetical protein
VQHADKTISKAASMTKELRMYWSCRIEYRLEHILSSEMRLEELLRASLIHIDINHHGDVEDAILQVTITLSRQPVYARPFAKTLLRMHFVLRD